MKLFVVIFSLVSLLASGPLQAESDEDFAPPGWLGFGLSCQSNAETGETSLRIRDTTLTASAAGLQNGDNLLEVDGATVACRQQLDALKLFSNLKPGQRVELSVLRSGVQTDVELEAVTMPSDQRKQWVEQYRNLMARGRAIRNG